ncbi:hypothetical protein MG293_010917 [Ovis ammon polii]|uniref:Uncharacterized protein n=1 Tax=Ovis ammon polii TaxID=230172 RepID=A0AAD4U6V8_OVIAM|nr:hypothetical protein MG293_010917 [Ovis ammon polii]
MRPSAGSLQIMEIRFKQHISAYRSSPGKQNVLGGTPVITVGWLFPGDSQVGSSAVNAVTLRDLRPGKGPGKVVSCILLLVKRILGEEERHSRNTCDFHNGQSRQFLLVILVEIMGRVSGL